MCIQLFGRLFPLDIFILQTILTTTPCFFFRVCVCCCLLFIICVSKKRFLFSRFF